MLASSAEDSQLCIQDWRYCEKVELKSDVLLDNVRGVLKQLKVRAIFKITSSVSRSWYKKKNTRVFLPCF